MGSLDQLYQQVILDHARERHGSGLRPAGPAMPAADSRQRNPLCGDEVTVRVVLADSAASPCIEDVSWTGEGCSISQASTSMLHDLVIGRSPAEADAVVAEFRAMIRAGGGVIPDDEVLGDAAALAGVGRHANRVKCAMLGWTAFEDALRRAMIAPGDVPTGAVPTGPVPTRAVPTGDPQRRAQ